MIEGEPERDVMAMDVARFGDWITPGYTLPKVIENYQKRFSVAYPNEELPAARPIAPPDVRYLHGWVPFGGNNSGLKWPTILPRGRAHL